VEQVVRIRTGETNEMIVAGRRLKDLPLSRA
jgi:hypothetical protein